VASVALDHVCKTYGRVSAVEDVSFAMPDGEFLALVGPSGCGKSTLLRMIAGLETITAGTVSIGGRVVNDLAPKDRDIAMVFQSYALYPHLTVARNMAQPLRLAGRPRSEINARVGAAAEILSLTPLLERYPRQLSGGQRQRVAMGRAIVRDPRVFLFDEPLSNLDAKLRVQMRSEIKELHQRLRTSTIYVTHDQVEAMTMADRIIVMNGGRVEQIGEPLSLYDRPANVFVAGFLGSPAMNLFSGRVERTDAAIALKLESGAVIRLPTGRDPEQLGNAVIVGIRPEHLLIAEPPQIPNLEAVVAVVEPTGADTLAMLRLGPTNISVLFRDRVTLAPGAILPLRFAPNRLHLFDAETGMRIGVTYQLDPEQQA